MSLFCTYTIYPVKRSHKGGCMGHKKMKHNLGFADFALASLLEHIRSIKLMEKVSDSINWVSIDTVLMSHYTVGTSGEGANVYPPLLPPKYLILQNWSPAA